MKNVLDLFDQVWLPPGQAAEFPVDFTRDGVVCWVIPAAGAAPEKVREHAALMVPTFDVETGGETPEKAHAAFCVKMTVYTDALLHASLAPENEVSGREEAEGRLKSTSLLDRPCYNRTVYICKPGTPLVIVVRERPTIFHFPAQEKPFVAQATMGFGCLGPVLWRRGDRSE